MPFLPLTGMLGQTRTLYADADSNDPALADSELTALLNEIYLFYSLKVEKRVSEFTANQAGFSFVAPAAVATGTETDWYEITQAYLAVDGDTLYGTPLEIVKVAEILRLQQSSPTPGTITKVAFGRVASAITANIGPWKAYVHPIPDNDAYISTLVRAWPTALSSSLDTPDLSELAAYTVCAITAARAAAIIGEDQQFIENILATVPDETRELMGMPRPGFKAPMVEQRAA